jgi:hypothetical protein
MHNPVNIRLKNFPAGVFNPLDGFKFLPGYSPKDFGDYREFDTLLFFAGFPDYLRPVDCFMEGNFPDVCRVFGGVTEQD